jgi:hypothetical protein
MNPDGLAETLLDQIQMPLRRGDSTGAKRAAD